jgi:hypothetical protein
VFDAEREFFVAFRSGLSARPEVLGELLGALDAALRRYNTTVWENRFIVGGVTEQIVGSAARAVGLSVANAGKRNQGYDLELSTEPAVGISVKGVFASVNGYHNLINTRGAADNVELIARWQTATIFIMAGAGIGYVDPELGSGFLKCTSDALQISGRDLRDFWMPNSAWILEADVPKKPTGEAQRVASDAVSFDIFADFPILQKNWLPEI